jgi:hypothetical protein
VLFWFHLNQGWRPKVRPPRSTSKKGLFATRSPHRPNPIGLSVVELRRIEGRTLHVQGVDMVDGSPVLDLKPYVPYADSVGGNPGWLASDAGAGQLTPTGVEPDPGPRHAVTWSDRANVQVHWLEQRTGLALRLPIEQRLTLGPGHHYRRTWQEGEQLVMAYRSWRVRCTPRDQTLTVSEIVSGYSEHDLLHGPSSLVRWPEDGIELHREYVAWRGTE